MAGLQPWQAGPHTEHFIANLDKEGNQVPVPYHLYFSNPPNRNYLLSSKGVGGGRPRGLQLNDDGSLPDRSNFKHMNSTEVWQQTQNIRCAHLDRVSLIRIRPQTWEDLWDYFDGQDIYYLGAYNAFNVISLLIDQNNWLDPQINESKRKVFAGFIDEWIRDVPTAVERLRTWDHGVTDASALMAGYDNFDVGNLSCGDLQLLSFMLAERHDKMFKQNSQKPVDGDQSRIRHWVDNTNKEINETPASQLTTINEETPSDSVAAGHATHSGEADRSQSGSRSETLKGSSANSIDTHGSPVKSKHSGAQNDTEDQRLETPKKKAAKQNPKRGFMTPPDRPSHGKAHGVGVLYSNGSGQSSATVVPWPSLSSSRQGSMDISSTNLNGTPTKVHAQGSGTRALLPQPAAQGFVGGAQDHMLPPRPPPNPNFGFSAPQPFFNNHVRGASAGLGHYQQQQMNGSRPGMPLHQQQRSVSCLPPAGNPPHQHPHMNSHLQQPQQMPVDQQQPQLGAGQSGAGSGWTKKDEQPSIHGMTYTYKGKNDRRNSTTSFGSNTNNRNPSNHAGGDGGDYKGKRVTPPRQLHAQNQNGLGPGGHHQPYRAQQPYYAPKMMHPPECLNWGRDWMVASVSCPCPGCLQKSRTVLVRPLGLGEPLESGGAKNALREYFRSFGEVEHVEIRRARPIDHKKASALVRFTADAAAVAAVKDSDSVFCTTMKTILRVSHPKCSKFYPGNPNFLPRQQNGLIPGPSNTATSPPRSLPAIPPAGVTTHQRIGSGAVGPSPTKHGQQNQHQGTQQQLTSPFHLQNAPLGHQSQLQHHNPPQFPVHNPQQQQQALRPMAGNAYPPMIPEGATPSVQPQQQPLPGTHAGGASPRTYQLPPRPDGPMNHQCIPGPCDAQLQQQGPVSQFMQPPGPQHPAVSGPPVLAPAYPLAMAGNCYPAPLPYPAAATTPQQALQFHEQRQEPLQLQQQQQTLGPLSQIPVKAQAQAQAQPVTAQPAAEPAAEQDEEYQSKPPSEDLDLTGADGDGDVGTSKNGEKKGEKVIKVCLPPRSDGEVSPRSQSISSTTSAVIPPAKANGKAIGAPHLKLVAVPLHMDRGAPSAASTCASFVTASETVDGNEDRLLGTGHSHSPTTPATEASSDLILPASIEDYGTVVVRRPKVRQPVPSEWLAAPSGNASSHPEPEKKACTTHKVEPVAPKEPSSGTGALKRPDDKSITDESKAADARDDSGPPSQEAPVKKGKNKKGKKSRQLSGVPNVAVTGDTCESEAKIEPAKTDFSPSLQVTGEATGSQGNTAVHVGSKKSKNKNKKKKASQQLRTNSSISTLGDATAPPSDTLSSRDFSGRTSPGELEEKSTGSHISHDRRESKASTVLSGDVNVARAEDHRAKFEEADQVSVAGVNNDQATNSIEPEHGSGGSYLTRSPSPQSPSDATAPAPSLQISKVRSGTTLNTTTQPNIPMPPPSATETSPFAAQKYMIDRQLQGKTDAMEGRTSSNTLTRCPEWIYPRALVEMNAASGSRQGSRHVDSGRSNDDDPFVDNSTTADSTVRPTPSAHGTTIVATPDAPAAPAASAAADNAIQNQNTAPASITTASGGDDLEQNQEIPSLTSGVVDTEAATRADPVQLPSDAQPITPAPSPKRSSHSRSGSTASTLNPEAMEFVCSPKQPEQMQEHYPPPFEAGGGTNADYTHPYHYMGQQRAFYQGPAPVPGPDHASLAYPNSSFADAGQQPFYPQAPPNPFAGPIPTPDAYHMGHGNVPNMGQAYQGYPHRYYSPSASNASFANGNGFKVEQQNKNPKKNVRKNKGAYKGNNGAPKKANGVSEGSNGAPKKANGASEGNNGGASKKANGGPTKQDSPATASAEGVSAAKVLQQRHREQEAANNNSTVSPAEGSQHKRKGSKGKNKQSKKPQQPQQPQQGDEPSSDRPLSTEPASADSAAVATSQSSTSPPLQHKKNGDQIPPPVSAKKEEWPGLPAGAAKPTQPEDVERDRQQQARLQRQLSSQHRRSSGSAGSVAGSTAADEPTEVPVTQHVQYSKVAATAPDASAVSATLAGGGNGRKTSGGGKKPNGN